MLHTTTLLPDGTLLVAGGIGRENVMVASAEIFDPATGQAVTVGPLSVPRAYHTATLLPDGRVLIAGGDTEPMSNVPSLGSTELYDPATGRFTPGGDLEVPRKLHTATSLADGQVLFVGGMRMLADSAGVSAGIRKIERFDPATGTSSLVGELEHGRAGHTATLLTDGRILVAGGEPTVSTEVVDGMTGDSVAAGPSSVARWGHQATLLDDGTVLITGGMVASEGPAMGRALAGAELFDPSVGRFVASGPIAQELASTPPVVPTPSPRTLGRTVPGGRVELPGSGFAFTVPRDWTVELVTPDPALEAALPGAAWEALRARDPGRRRACTVSVGVAPEGLSLQDQGAGIGTTGDAEPSWSDGRDVPMLLIPDRSPWSNRTRASVHPR